MEKFIKIVTAVGTLCMAVASVVKELNNYNEAKKKSTDSELCTNPYYDKKEEPNCTPSDVEKK